MDATKVLEDNAEILSKSRAEISALLLPILKNLDSIFEVEEKSESNTWVVCSDGYLMFSSIILLEAAKDECFESVTRLKECLQQFDGVAGPSQLNSCSVFLFDHRVEIFVHRGNPQVYVRIYIAIPTTLTKIDEQALSEAYFAYICKNSIRKELTQVEERAKPLVVESDSLYQDLY